MNTGLKFCTVCYVLHLQYVCSEKMTLRLDSIRQNTPTFGNVVQSEGYFEIH